MKRSCAGPTHRGNDAELRRAHSTRRGFVNHYPFAAEILAFYRRICVIQQKLSKEISACWDRQSRLPAAIGTLREQMDLELVLPLRSSSFGRGAWFSRAARAVYQGISSGSAERWAVSLQRYVTQGGANGGHGGLARGIAGAHFD